MEKGKEAKKTGQKSYLTHKHSVTLNVQEYRFHADLFIGFCESLLKVIQFLNLEKKGEINFPTNF